MNKHPISITEELFEQWHEEWKRIGGSWPLYAAIQAARWGADQELEACCQEVHDWYGNGSRLRDTRRPKPPSLKEQALQALYRFDDNQGHEGLTSEQIADDFVLIRRALEALPDV